MICHLVAIGASHFIESKPAMGTTAGGTTVPVTRLYGTGTVYRRGRTWWIR